MNNDVKRSALLQAASASGQIEELRAERTKLINSQALALGVIDQKLNILYAKLSTALSMATD